jgi:hypothetical protein
MHLIRVGFIKIRPHFKKCEFLKVKLGQERILGPNLAMTYPPKKLNFDRTLKSASF